MKLLTLPALIDPHVHLRDPGATHKENFETGTKAALAGGITAVLDMPNNPNAPILSDASLKTKETVARKKSYSYYGLYFGASKNNYRQFNSILSRVCALKVYMDSTTGDLLVDNLQMLKNIFSYWKSNTPIVVHAEDARLAEAIGLAMMYGRKLHIAHVSQKSELELIIQAKEKGISITCEVTPHHLFLSEKDARVLGGFGLVKPPLRKSSDIDFLWKHIDAIDCIATDHAPHTVQEKQSKNPPFGVPGVETSLPLLLSAVKNEKLAIEDIIRLMHSGPKKIFSLDSNKNSYCVVDANVRYSIENSKLVTKCGWSPFEGMTVRARVVTTIINGESVYNDGEFLKRPSSNLNLFT